MAFHSRPRGFDLRTPLRRSSRAASGHARSASLAIGAWFALASSLAACSPELAVPDEAQLSCSAGDACPEGRLCFEGACRLAAEVPTGPRVLPDLLGPPTVEPALGTTGTSFAVGFVLDRKPAEPPALELDLELPGTVGPVEVPCQEPEPLTYLCSYRATGEENGGNGGTVRFDVRLAKELRKAEVGRFELDFAAPAIVADSTAVRLSPPATSPIAEVQLATTGTTVIVSFETSEPLADGSSVRATLGDATLSLPLSAAGGRAYRTELVLGPSATIAAGSYALAALLHDVAGNEAEVALEETLAISAGRPGPPDVATPGRLVYRRIPWGAEESRGPPCAGAGVGPVPCFLVEGDRAAPAGGTVLAWESLDGNAAELGRAQADELGSFVVRLPARDRDAVAVSVADRAGNVSERVLVRDEEWVATLGRKEPGSTFENPTSVVTTPVFAPVLEQDPLRAREPSAAELAALATADGALAGAVVRAGEATWTPRTTTGPRPLERADHALAWDAGRGKVVLFGGRAFTASQTAADTWEWDGATGSWTDRTPPGRGPSGRWAHSMAYDARRGRVVLFGGYDWSSKLADTWEWDGATGSWIERTPPAPTVGPTARLRHAMAWDGNRGRVVLFGGEAVLAGSTSSRPVSELWEWDGDAGRWEERTTEGVRPPGRFGHALAWDATHRKVVLFGGTAVDLWGGNFPQPGVRGGDLWEWDGAGWTERSWAGPGPAPRAAHSLAWDVSRERLLLLGGLDAGGNERDDLWEWDATASTWEERIPEGPAPRPIMAGAAVFDSARNRLVSFGGNDTSDRTQSGYRGSYTDLLGGLWEWDGSSATWAERSPLPAHPGRRTGAGVTFDRGRRRAILFGGTDDTGALRRDLWEWEPGSGSWLDRTPSPLPPDWPAARRDHALVHDPVGGEVLLLGGVGEAGTLDDCFLLEPGAAAFRRTAGQRPPARSQVAAAVDPGSGRVLVFGGFDVAGRPLGDLWSFAGGAWAVVPTGGGPAPEARGAGAMVFDPVSRDLFLVGGLGAAGALGDGWLGHAAGASWEQLPGSPEAPGPRWSHALVHDDFTGKVILFGGLSDVFGDASGWPTRDVHVHDGAGWRLWSPPSYATPSPHEGFGHAFMHDPEARVSYLLAGAGTTDAWQFDAASGLQSAAGPWQQRGTPGVAPEAGAWLAAHDPDRRQTLITFPTPGGPTRTWEWDGDRGRFTDRNPAAGASAAAPPPRYDGALGFAGACGSALLFGGQGRDDSWLWSSGVGWTEELFAPSPPGRSHHSLAWDSARAKLMLFGGEGADGRLLDDLWEWDCQAGWSELSPAGPLPPARSRHGLAHDGRRGVLVVFGGSGATGPLDDLWEWDGAAWVEGSPTPPAAGSWPRPRTYPGLAFDPARGKLLLHGGADGGLLLDDEWEWDGESFRERTPGGRRPAPRRRAALVSDPGRGVLTLAGGEGKNELWDRDGGARDRPAVVWGVPWSAAGATGATLTSATVTVHAGAGAGGLGATELLAWDGAGGGWRELASGSPASPLGAVRADLQAGLLEPLLFGRAADLTLAIAPAEPSGDAAEPATVAVDYLELRIRYRR